MGKTFDGLVLAAVLACSAIYSHSVQAQSAESIASSVRSSGNAKTLPHGDVQNIGNRDVSKRIYGILPNVLSLEKEIALGQQLSAEFEQTVRILKDADSTEYIELLGQNLVRHSDSKVPFHFKVLDANDVNAFAFPGGFLYITRGLVLEAESESELAAVMAHAIAHVCARHATRLQSMKEYLQSAAGPAVAPAQIGIQNNLSLGISLTLLGTNRQFEMEADQLGIQYLWNTGYDPDAFTRFLERMQAKEKGKSLKPAGFFRTHPSPANRIEECLEEQRALPKKDRYAVSSSEFDRIKARLRATE